MEGLLPGPLVELWRRVRFTAETVLYELPLQFLSVWAQTLPKWRTFYFKQSYVFFWQAQLLKKLLSFDFWISCHFVAIFRNISTFQNAITAKAIELFKELYHICFYLVMLFKHYLFVTSIVKPKILLSIIWRHFAQCQKPLKSKNKKHTVVWSTKFYHPVNFGLKRIKTVKVVPRVQFQA